MLNNIIMDELESLDNLRTSLEAQNTKVEACSGWREVSKEYLMDTFVFEDAAMMTEEDLCNRVIDMFSQKPEIDPLSEDSLREKFPNFPETWYTFMAEAARDKFKVLEAEKKDVDEVTVKEGNFKISFN